MKHFVMQADGSFHGVREDGVEINCRSRSGNGELIRDTAGNVRLHVTAHDGKWASVPVGYFTTASEALVAGCNFIMPR
jgi:hypothetical protein